MSQKETFEYAAEVGRVLQLVINSLYKNKDIFLRELISNASDACDKLKFESQTNQQLIAGDSKFVIKVAIDKKKRILTVSDNGIGMNRDDMIANLGTIARSGTAEFMKKLEESQGSNDIDLIGQFGVGFYSAFMVASEIEVISKKAGEDKSYKWQSKGDGAFSISELSKDDSDVEGRGTRIILHLKKGEDEFLDKFRLEHIIKTYSDHISHSIELIDEDGGVKTVNNASALWARSKSEISDEQYKEFYRHVAHSFDEPYMVIHNKNEGKIEYTNLLYIPSRAPFDLFHPDRIRRVKLYVKRVFITDEGIDLIPHYLRFVRGVIDCEDLPLNVSRETLQHNSIVEKIKQSVTKRILSELKKKADKDADNYADFWKNFGAVIKEGLCEHSAHKQDILEICRFNSTMSQLAQTENDKAKMIGFDDYIKTMKEGQEEIYYFGCDNVSEGMKSPLLEGFTKRGINVLLFTDHVDDFWVNVVHEYNDKKLTSITRSNIDLSWAGDIESEQSSGSDNASSDSGKSDNKIEIERVIEFMKKEFGESVSDIRSSGKLAHLPATLSVAEGGMDIRMERYLYEQKQLRSRSAKILEINPQHPVIKSLAKVIANDNNSAKASDIAGLILDQARIVAGEEISDTGSFSRRLTELLQSSI